MSSSKNLLLGAAAAAGVISKVEFWAFFFLLGELELFTGVKEGLDLKLGYLLGI